MKHPYSAVKTFNTCPRQYEALYILRNVPRKSSPALEKGIAWHKALEDQLGELPSVEGESWSGIAVLFLSTAVELWANSIAGALVEALEIIEESNNADNGRL